MLIFFGCLPQSERLMSLLQTFFGVTIVSSGAPSATIDLIIAAFLKFTQIIQVIYQIISIYLHLLI